MVAVAAVPLFGVEGKTLSLKVIGAGHGRTGTNSLKLALEKLLGEPCYHMLEVFGTDHVEMWRRAALGELPDWTEVFTGYGAAVDWPVALFWEEIRESFPDALVILSTRDPAEWWESASRTIFAVHTPEPSFQEMVKALEENRFAGDPQNRDSAIAAFKAHNQFVIDSVPDDQLLVWEASEGWDPICEALDLPVPLEDFPFTNTREEWGV